MEEFNLEEFKKNPSQKVVTRDGRSVRIICTDAKGDEPIIALVYNKIKDEENVYTYNRDGYFYGDNDSYLDLFFDINKREGWINLYKGIVKDYLPSVGQKIYKSKESAIKNKRDDNYLITVKIEWEE